jgi:ribonuclease HII
VVAQVGPSVIDEQGITCAIQLAIARCLHRLDMRPELVALRLDGSLHAPAEYEQATIVKGDALYPEIGLASIIAKETRDAYMTRIARRYTQYGFAEHKGYGTVAHRQAIKQYGLCPIHRASFCGNCR